MNPLKQLRIERQRNKRKIERQRNKRKIEQQRDALLKAINKMSAEAQRIRGLPRDEVDALIAETVGANSHRI